jgi:hypothetical protein
MRNVLTGFAQKITQGDINYHSTLTNENALQEILDLVYLWAGIIAVVVIIVAGIFFVSSRGNADQVKRAKDAIRGAVVGLIIVMIAFAITRFVIGGTQG